MASYNDDPLLERYQPGNDTEWYDLTRTNQEVAPTSPEVKKMPENAIFETAAAIAKVRAVQLSSGQPLFPISRN